MNFAKFPQFDPSLGKAWINWTELETALGDIERTRAIFELAVQQSLDMPELVWKAYIDFEAGEGEREKTRALYERLLQKTAHVKVSYPYILSFGIDGCRKRVCSLNFDSLDALCTGLHLLRPHGILPHRSSSRR